MAKQNRVFCIPERRSRRSEGSLAGNVLKGLASASMAVAGGWIVYSHLVVDHHAVLPDALPAERNVFHSRSAGRLSYYHNRVDTGRPLVLIHSVNAAASAYEMRPLFLHYRDQRPVFALDLPGFGFSERANRIYAPNLFESAILDFLSQEVGEPADVVALSLGSEFAARAALAQPDLFASLVVISPTGFSVDDAGQGSQAASKLNLSDFIHPIFSFPIWGRPFYDLLSTRSSIEYFLKKSFLGPVPQDLIDYDYASAHQPGAEHAPLYFISGKLFTPDIRTSVYDRLQVPTLALYDRDNFTSFEMLPETLAGNTYWQAVRLVPTLGLPHFERPDDTVEVLDSFWK